jgi:hypothetical protein
MRYSALILAASMLATILPPMSSSAQPYRARQGVQSGQVRSLDEILNGIRQQRPGSLADVQGPNPSLAGDPRYRLKWLTPDGRVLWLDTDARTGRVLGVEGDDRGPPAAAPRGVPGGFARPGFYAPGGPPVGPPPGYGRPPPQVYGPPAGYDPRLRGGVPPPGYGYGRVPPPGFGGYGRPVPPPRGGGGPRGGFRGGR